MKILDVPQSGSIAGSTSSRNRFGQYRRTRAIPTQPRTSKQVANRALFGVQSLAWQGLTGAQRSAWAAWALTHPYVDPLGQSIVLTGHQFFIGVNVRLVNSGAAPVTDPPTFDPTFTDIAVSASVTTAAGLTLSFPLTDPAEFVNVFCSPPLSPGVTFNGNWRYLATQQTDDTVIPTLNVVAALTAIWGTLAVGTQFQFRWDYSNPLGSFAGGGKFAVVLT